MVPSIYRVSSSVLNISLYSTGCYPSTVIMVCPRVMTVSLHSIDCTPISTCDILSHINTNHILNILDSTYCIPLQYESYPSTALYILHHSAEHPRPTLNVSPNSTENPPQCWWYPPRYWISVDVLHTHSPVIIFHVSTLVDSSWDEARLEGKFTKIICETDFSTPGRSVVYFSTLYSVAYEQISIWLPMFLLMLQFLPSKDYSHFTEDQSFVT